MNNFCLFFLTFFKIGFIKYAPGSIASLIALLLWFYVPNLFLFQFFLIFSILFLGFMLCYYYNKNINNDDPSFIVIDEVAGMVFSLFMLPKDLTVFILAFLLFRYLDIFKPFFISKVEKAGFGAGIMLDDLLAALYTLIIMKILTIYILT